MASLSVSGLSDDLAAKPGDEGDAVFLAAAAAVAAVVAVVKLLVFAVCVDSFTVRTVVVCRLGLRSGLCCWDPSPTRLPQRSADLGLCRSGLTGLDDAGIKESDK